MAIGANSYGTAAGVAALVPRYGTLAGVFDTSTRPTLTQVEGFIDQVSAALNAILAQNGFSIPVSDADAVLLLALFVNQETAAICEGVNGSGRFGPLAGAPDTKGRWAVIVADAQDFVTDMAVGLERLGATRTYDVAAGIAYRDTDESGDATFPLFQVKAFGAEFTDWDS